MPASPPTLLEPPPQPTLPDPPPQAPPRPPPPIRPSLNPPPPPPRGLRPTVSWGGSWRPEPRGCPPRGILLSCTSSRNLLFLNPGVCRLLQATLGVGTVLIWDFCVALTTGGGTPCGPAQWKPAPNSWRAEWEGWWLMVKRSWSGHRVPGSSAGNLVNGALWQRQNPISRKHDLWSSREPCGHRKQVPHRPHQGFIAPDTCPLPTSQQIACSSNGRKRR